MNKEIKETNELAYLIAKAIVSDKTAQETAEYILEKGYRKQSDVAREFAEKLLMRLSDYIMRDFEDEVPYYSADCEQIDDVIATIATEYGVEVE